MADRKISDLTALTTPASGDYLPIVDISEAAAASKNKRITIEELMRGMPDGTAAAPGIAFESDPNTGIYSPGADQLAVSTGGTGRLFVDASGNVGIGTTSPGTFLAINDPGTGLGFTNAASGNFNLGLLGGTGSNEAYVYQRANGPLLFGTNNTERLRIDSSGRLLVGTSTNSAVSTLVLQGNSTSSVGASFLFLQRGVSVPGTDDSLGVLTFGNNASNLGAQIFGSRDGGTWTSGSSHPGRLLFSTTADGASTPTERMRIRSDGNIGINTTVPASKLHVNGDVTITDKIIHAGDTDTAIRFLAADTVTVETGGSERMRVTSAGNLLVGTTGAVSVNGLTAGLELHATATTDGASASIARFNDDTSGSQLNFGKSRSGTLSPGTAVQNNDILGEINFCGDDGTDINTRAARIACEIDGTPDINDMPGRLVFSTTPDGNSSPTERMRITNDGGFMVGQTVTVAPGFGNVVVGAGFSNTDKVLYVSSSNPALRLNRNSDGSIVDFRRSGSAGVVGTISVTTTATAYNTSSDYRLKENVVPLDGAITRLNQLPVHRFNFIADPDTVVDGFIAHEAQAVVPECVTGEKDAVDDDGNPVYQGIDQSKLVPLLTAALQEAVAKIESLEARLTAAGL